MVTQTTGKVMSTRHGSACLFKYKPDLFIIFLLKNERQHFCTMLMCSPAINSPSSGGTADILSAFLPYSTMYSSKLDSGETEEFLLGGEPEGISLGGGSRVTGQCFIIKSFTPWNK